MNTRTIEMCHMLLENDSVHTVTSLAAYFAVSQRMIRMDFEDITGFLGFSCAQIKINEQGKVFFEGDKTTIRERLDTINYSEYTLSQDERFLATAMILLVSEGYVTLLAIADMLSVSRSTVAKDVDNLKRFLNEYEVDLETRSNHGISIRGLEIKLRAFLLVMLTKRINEVNRFFSQDSLDETWRFKLEMLKKTVEVSENETRVYLAPNSFHVLVYYLFIASKRIELGFELEVVERFDESSFMKHLVLNLGETIQSRSEKAGLAVVANSLNYLTRNIKSQSIIQTQMVTRQFIESISHDLHIDLNRNYSFYENLSAHLASLIDKSGPKIEEFPEIKEMVRRKEWLLNIVRDNVAIIETSTHHVLSDVEIDYIVIYVSSAIEQLKNAVSLRILVVCDSGIATNQLLKARIKQQFGFDATQSISSREVQDVLTTTNYDLVLTTVPIVNEKVPVVHVSPLLNEKDLENINRHIDGLRMKAITNYDVEEPNILDRYINESDELDRVKNQVIVDEFLEDAGLHGLPRLSDILREDYIQFDVEAKDWKEAITKSAQPMLENGDIDASYIDIMIKQVEDNGPYIVITKGVAFPHGSYDQGTHRVAMSFIKLKEPVYFGSNTLDPVNLVCALSPVDHNQHLRAFFTLVNLLLNKGYKEALLSSKSAEEVRRVIEKYERSV